MKLSRTAALLLLAACRSGSPEIAAVADAAADAVATSDVAPFPDGPVPADSSPSPTSLFEIYGRAGVVTGSCIEDDGINRHVARLWDPLGAPQWFARSRPQAQCLATAGGGCAALRTCLGYGLSIGGPPCTTSCSGTVLTFCGASGARTYRMTIDCGKVGLACNPLNLCSDQPSEACEEASFMPVCTPDGRRQHCKRTRTMRGPVCADLDLLCQGGTCTGHGAACNGGEPGAEGQVYLEGIACDGTRLRACVGGKEQTFDCAQQGQGQGFSCQSADNMPFCGLGSECFPSESGAGTITCEGNAVVICNAGRLQRIDCTTLGFTGCEFDLRKGHYGCIPPAAPVEIP